VPFGLLLFVAFHSSQKNPTGVPVGSGSLCVWSETTSSSNTWTVWAICGPGKVRKSSFLDIYKLTPRFASPASQSPLRQTRCPTQQLQQRSQQRLVKAVSLTVRPQASRLALRYSRLTRRQLENLSEKVIHHALQSCAVAVSEVTGGVMIGRCLLLLPISSVSKQTL
jgi:hypothetical protein